MPEAPLFSSPLLGLPVTLGNLSVWLGLATAVLSVVFYWIAMIRSMREAKAAATAPPGPPAGKKKNGRHLPPSEEREPLTASEMKTHRIANWARRLFFVNAAFVILGTISLWVLILNQQYAVHYIWKNTNNALPFGYRFAAFWSDQEGTFFLWGLYNVLIGSLLIRKAQPEERWVMPFFTLINVSLFTLLTFMNPFWMVAPGEVREQLLHAMQEQGLTQAMIDQTLSFLPSNSWEHLGYYFGWAKYWTLTDGRGLNESLQNFWMVIHPPTLFVGYSSMIVPGCFALGALMKRDYDSWIHRAAPWLGFSWMILGIGIFLGAYWAYETLGWGGYWSWDPVENSSIIPWLVGTALIHGMLGQRNRGNFKQANLFLGVMALVSVLLSSFLVRSGVLGDTSVHAFASPQQSVFYTLLSVLIVGFVMGVGIWLWRYKDIQAEIAYDDIWERHFGFFLGLIVLSASAAVIGFGVTLPIWKPWLPLGGGGKLNVDYTFYNKALLPVMFVIVVLMTLTPLMPWKKVRDESKPMRPFSIGVLWLTAAVSLFFLGGAFYAWKNGFLNPHNDFAYLGFGLMIGVALTANFVCLARAARGGYLNTGPWLAHIGFLTMLLGVLLTSRFNTTHPVTGLGKDESLEVLGIQWTYKGRKEATNPADRSRMLIDMTQNGKTVALAPKLFITKMNGKEQLMAWPQIIHQWFGGAWGDIYVEPSGVDMGGTTWQGLEKDTPTPAAVQYKHGNPRDEVVLTFEGLDTDEMQKAVQGGGGSGKPFNIYARVRLHVNGTEKSLRPALRFDMASGTRDPIPTRVEGFNQGMGYSLVFQQTNLNPTQLTADFALIPDVPVERGHFQVLHVPFIHVLWWGCYIMFLGAFFCWRRRVNFASRPVPAPKAIRSE